MTDNKEKYMYVRVSLERVRQKLTVVSETKTQIVGRDSLGNDYQFTKYKEGQVFIDFENGVEIGTHWTHGVCRTIITESFYKDLDYDYTEGESGE